MAKKVPKSIERRVQDLLEYHQCLGDDIRAYLNGKQWRLKTILAVLRVLVCDGLVFELDKEWQIGPAIVLHGLPNIPPTNPLSKDMKVGLADYINLKEYGCMPMNGVVMSNKELIKGYADQDGSHSDSGTEPHIHGKVGILVGGMPALDRHVISVAKNVFDSIEAMIQVEANRPQPSSCNGRQCVDGCNALNPFS